MGIQFKAISKVLIRPEDDKRYRSGPLERNEAEPREKDPMEEFEKEGQRLDLYFNGMQERINDQPPVALFTDKETKSTFGVEPGQSVRSKLRETRGKFRPL